jgi:hypothetical protein
MSMLTVVNPRTVWLRLTNASLVGAIGQAASEAATLWGTRGWATTPATGATAGKPGSWTPTGAAPPATVAAIAALPATPVTAWTSGQYVQTGTAGIAGRAFWNGTAWTAGVAP